ncbi:MAG: tetratricopeptide repeat protein, partial [Anaerolineae bacterium]
MRQVAKGRFLVVLLLGALMLVACGKETASVEEASVKSTQSAEAGQSDTAVDEAWVKERLARGNEFAQAGEFDKAVEEYRAILEEEPGNVSALSNLGVVYYHIGQLDQAISWYEKALEIAPQDAGTHSNLAAAYV